MQVIYAHVRDVPACQPVLVTIMMSGAQHTTLVRGQKLCLGSCLNELCSKQESKETWQLYEGCDRLLSPHTELNLMHH